MKYGHRGLLLATAGAVAISATAATTAAAQQQWPIETVVGKRSVDSGRSVNVSHRDLNLAAAHDEKILHRRVASAARDLCEPDNAYVGYGFTNCMSSAWRGARPQIALAVRRAREIAATGSSGIPLVAIAIIGS